MDFQPQLRQFSQQLNSGYQTITISFGAQDARLLEAGACIGSLELITEEMVEMVCAEAIARGARGVRFDGDGSGNWVIYLLH